MLQVYTSLVYTLDIVQAYAFSTDGETMII